MITPTKRNVVRRRVHKRVRSKVEGTTARRRLNVVRSLNHIFAQIIDDSNANTLVAASTLPKKGEDKLVGGNVEAARTVGKLVAERAKDKGITRVVFDRGGYLYHGRVKALADAAREAGLEF